ncbi:EAL domain-containing protein [Ciceribacter sp. RN22]|uniref:EAL domain-containing protein n=1 Tax=Ciceribacter sp. RN22 TaxID=2954932 RepID=UPI0020924053|nr:EAL domain-containing protein [Ciceribacter sp. RN22]MCO6180922.1 EAL domain-containing protein [Ciceribacter sp. RN22]
MQAERRTVLTYGPAAMNRGAGTADLRNLTYLRIINVLSILVSGASGVHVNKFDATIDTVISAMQQDRVGFSLQHVNAVTEHGDVLYSECLGRLVVADGSIVSAGEFVAQLEATGLASDFDHHILDLAFDYLATNENASLGVNLSTENFADERRWNRLYRQLSRHSSLSSRLVLEITESAPMALLSMTAEWIQEVRNLGFRIAVDDFGTGFSTPETLFSIATDIVKIDAFFVRRNRCGKTDRILAHMIGLAACAAPIVVVEGIETYDQFSLAKATGATHVQGFLFSEPTLTPVFGGLNRPLPSRLAERPRWVM